MSRRKRRLGELEVISWGDSSSVGLCVVQKWRQYQAAYAEDTLYQKLLSFDIGLPELATNFHFKQDHIRKQPHPTKYLFTELRQQW